VERLIAGPERVVIGFRGNAFANPAGLVNWLTGKGGKLGGPARLRPGHKLAIVRDMDVATRLRGALEVLGSLARIVGHAKAA